MHVYARQDVYHPGVVRPANISNNLQDFEIQTKFL